MSPPSYRTSVKKASLCRNERQEGLAGGKRVVREEGTQYSHFGSVNVQDDVLDGVRLVSPVGEQLLELSVIEADVELDEAQVVAAEVAPVATDRGLEEGS